MIPDTTLETVLNLWKEGKVNLGDVRKLLQMEQPIKWKQTEPIEHPKSIAEQFIPWIQPVGFPHSEGTSCATYATNGTYTLVDMSNPKTPFTYTSKQEQDIVAKERKGEAYQ